METLIKDIRFGIRGLLRQPGFAAVAIVTLALGIGINAALFSVVNGVLLNPLPLPEPDQLVTFDQSKPNFETGAIPYLNFLDLRKENQTFSAMTILRSQSFSLLGSGEPERVSGRYVSQTFAPSSGLSQFSVARLRQVRTSRASAQSCSLVTRSGSESSGALRTSPAGLSLWITNPSPSSVFSLPTSTSFATPT